MISDIDIDQLRKRFLLFMRHDKQRRSIKKLCLELEMSDNTLVAFIHGDERRDLRIRTLWKIEDYLNNQEKLI